MLTPTVYQGNNPTQEGSCLFVVQFRDPQTGSLISPVTLNWTLTDTSDTIINSRDSVSVDITAGTTSVDILLSGDDLQIKSAEASKRHVRRLLLIEATYHSDLGLSIPANELVPFVIENLYI
jgi:hypothetical protein